MSGVLRAAAAVTVAVLATAGPGAPAHAAAALPTVDYVSLGDSYAAGVGAGTPVDSCRNTEGAYPRRWTATDAKQVRLTTATCSGGKTADVLAAAAAVTAETDLVSITAGANDLGVTGAFAACMTPGRETDCAAAQAAIEAALRTTLPAAVGTVLTTVKERAPEAKVVLTGYPKPFSETGTCTGTDIPVAIRALGNRVMSGLNAVLAAQAKLAGVAYVDVESAFAGHEICSAAPWVVGFEGQADGTILHPNPTGHTEGYLPPFTKAVGTPQDVAQWIAERDAPPATPSPSGSVTPSASASPAPSAVAAPPRDTPSLPITGPDVVLTVLAGVALIAVGGAVYLLARRA
ncbi:SGNH/GDSL hydrolase family protein [Catenuloplanes atrovinosus]|uniref:Lysophospholipase L1-like esterase n=1 Tax=Catenuloplanes atrovinosus TaxID=137266 RepID=A0AAE3YYH8_9ACTN|nr:SGNH/GDSL hydrolase family protein [Catenuloplanes atrovinosus]MDR7280728.1 lysophospholipase L1-like esterase [Catenuloplanes atrovinosus]